MCLHKVSSKNTPKSNVDLGAIILKKKLNRRIANFL